MHARQQIVIAAIAALSAGVPAVAGRVFEDDGSNLRESQLPGLQVRAGDEIVEDGAGFKDRRLRLEVYAAAAGGADLQARLGAIATEVENVLDTALQVAGVAVPLAHRGITSDASVIQERPVSIVIFLYDAVYQTAHGQPEVLLP